MPSTSRIKRSIMKARGIGSMEKHTKRPVSIADQPAIYKKTDLMKLIETKHNEKLDKLLFTGTIYEVGIKLSIDPTTVSKWRKRISAAKERVFWEQFNNTKEKTNEESTVNRHGLDSSVHQVKES